MVGKLLPIVAEYNEIIKEYRLETILLRKAIVISDDEVKRLWTLNRGLEDLLIISQAKWWQSPVAIVVYMLASFTIGIMVAL